LLRAQVERRRERYAGLRQRLRASAAANLASHRADITRQRERLGTLAARAARAVDNLLETRWARCERDAQLLAALSYRGVLARGFALVRDRSGRPLRAAAAVSPGVPIGIEFIDGRVGARVEVVQAQTTQRAEMPTRRRRRYSDSEQGRLF